MHASRPDHIILDWQQRILLLILLDMVEARSVNNVPPPRLFKSQIPLLYNDSPNNFRETVAAAAAVAHLFRRLGADDHVRHAAALVVRELGGTVLLAADGRS